MTKFLRLNNNKLAVFASSVNNIEMNKEIWERIEVIYDQAIQLEDKDRLLFVKDSAAGDDTIYQQVIKMLNSDMSFMEEYPGLVSDTEKLTHQELTSLGHFKIIKKIATGGMGRVYLAQSMNSDVTILVALKTIRIELINQDLEQKFQNEKQILSRLKHKNIASLIDAGISDDNIPYIATEWVDGESISDYCVDNALSLNVRLNLFKQICSAVSFAHNKLIIHRDIKPDNILVDANGQVKLLDFGIAKIVDDNNNKQTQTQIYTPDYASPEQINGQLCTVATDVYSLGVVLFEILTNSKRFDLSGLTISEKIKAICEPKALDVKAIDSGFNIDSAILNIINKAMHVDQSRRYESVSSLTTDIDNYINNRPVSAMKDSFLYKAKMFLLRNRLASTLTALILVAVFSGLYINNNEVKMKLQEAKKSEVMLEFFQEVLETASPDQGGSTAITVKEMFDRGVNKYNLDQIDDPVIKSELAAQIGLIYTQLGEAEEGNHYTNSAIDFYQEDLSHIPYANKFLEYSNRIGFSYVGHHEYDIALNYINGYLEKIKGLKVRSDLLSIPYVYLGRIYSGLGNDEKTMDYLNKSEELALKVNYHLGIGMVNFYKYSLFNTSISDEQKMYYLNQAEINYEKADDKPNLLSVLGARAALLGTFGEYQKTEELFIKADIINKELFGRGDFIDLLHRAKNYNYLGRFNKALGKLNEAEKVYTDTNMNRPPAFYGMMSYKANSLVELGEFKEAEKLFVECKDFYVTIVPPGHRILKVLQNNLADLYLKSENNIKMDKFLSKLEASINEGNKSPSMINRLKVDTLRILGNLYLYKGNFAKSHTHYQQANKIVKTELKKYNEGWQYWELQTGLSLTKIKNGDIGGFENFHDNKNKLLSMVSTNPWYDNFFTVD